MPEREVWVVPEATITIWDELGGCNATSHYVVAATTGNLSSRSGLTAVDGITPVAGDKVCVWKQTDPTQNGIYTVAAGSWTLVQNFRLATPLRVNVGIGSGTNAGKDLFVTADDTLSLTPTPTLQRVVAYVRDVRVEELRETSTRKQPGATTPDFHSHPAGFRISVGELYQRKAEQLTPFLQARGKFSIGIALVNPNYTGTAPQENDSHSYRNASLVSGSLSGSDNAEVLRNLEFMAESMDS